MVRYKLVVTAPEDECKNLLSAIDQAGGGKIGNYTHCSFTVKGTGRFLPTHKAEPTLGKQGRLEEISEERIEVNCNFENLQAIVHAIRETHSYKEPVIDIYELKDLPE